PIRASQRPASAALLGVVPLHNHRSAPESLDTAAGSLASQTAPMSLGTPTHGLRRYMEKRYDLGWIPKYVLGLRCCTDQQRAPQAVRLDQDGGRNARLGSSILSANLASGH